MGFLYEEAFAVFHGYYFESEARIKDQMKQTSLLFEYTGWK